MDRIPQLQVRGRVLTALVLSLLSACGGEKSAEQVAILYLQALANGDFPTAFGLLCHETRSALAGAEAAHRVGQFSELAPAELKIVPEKTPGLGLYRARVTQNGRLKGPPVGDFQRPPVFSIATGDEATGLRLVSDGGVFRVRLRLSP